VMNPEMATADLWLAANVKVTLDRKAPHVKVLLARLGSVRHGLRSGWTILEAIVRGPADMDYRERRDIEEEFASASFFQPGMKAVRTQVAAEEFKQMFYLQPGRCYEHQEQLVEAFITKIPSALERWAVQVRDELDQALTTGVWPWTWEGLVKLLAIKLQALPVEGLLVAAVDAGKGGAEFDRWLQRITCYRCGERGHTAANCEKQCPKCDVKICRGAAGGECIVHGDVKPVQGLLGGSGHPYSAVQVSTLMEAWERARESKKAAAAAAVLKTRPGPAVSQGTGTSTAAETRGAGPEANLGEVDAPGDEDDIDFSIFGGRY
jgi:hypothetical protein